MIDDEELVGTLLQRFLQDVFDVTATTDSEAALDEISTGSFDLILTDLKMPRVTGLDILHRAQNVRPNLPVVVMSGHVAPDEGISEMVAQGAAGFLRKPFPRKAELQAYLNKILDRAA